MILQSTKYETSGYQVTIECFFLVGEFEETTRKRMKEQNNHLGKVETGIEKEVPPREL